MEDRTEQSLIESILFASGEPVKIGRISAVLGMEEAHIEEIAAKLQAKYESEQSGIRLIRIEDRLQLCSAQEFASEIRRTLEMRRPQRLTPTALEVLAIVAYFQPVTRAYIEKTRGIDSSYTVGILQERGLIESCGKLDVPGHPTLFRTTEQFLRNFGISSLDELPPIPEMEISDGQMEIQMEIEALKGPDSEPAGG